MGGGTMTAKLVKSDLEMHSPDGLCDGDGFRFLLDDLESEVQAANSKPIPVDAYLKAKPKSLCVGRILQDSKTSAVAKQFLSQLATYDEEKNSISPFDLVYSNYALYGEAFQEAWQPELLGNASRYSSIQKIRHLGSPLFQTAGSQALQARSLLALRSLAVYLSALPATDARGDLSPLVNYYFNQKETEGFSRYLSLSLKDFLLLDEAAKQSLFSKAIQRQFPDAKNLETIFPYLSFGEALQFTAACFKAEARSSLALFEKIPLPKLRSPLETPSANSEERQIFPNLPQSTAYADRQKAIDDYLGTPVLTRRTNIWQAASAGASTVLKKYQWVGNTEIFSIESGKPGPTTLVFSPHFHEDNPRKVFHWMKDIPLQSGRILFLPEANRAMGLLKRDTVRMNRIFNRALNDDAPDYLVVRRTEYLMGLVDGMVGLHDWRNVGPFFISDVVPGAGPVTSPWVSQDVKNISAVSRDIFVERQIEGLFSQGRSSQLGTPLQSPWQLAEFAAQKLQGLTGNILSFRASPVDDLNTLRLNNSTAYMNYFLKKPAMTFEGKGGAEQGQLMAQALYTLLLAFGHQVAPSFEQALKNPAPKVEPSLYQGLEITR